MRERIEGQGALEIWGEPDKMWPVHYLFDITTDISEKPLVTRHSTGDVRAVSGQPIPEGYYRLIATDGEALKVKNLGSGLWTILAS